MLTLKLSSNQTLTQNLILTPKKQMKNTQINSFHFRFILFNLKIFGEIVTTILPHTYFKAKPNFPICTVYNLQYAQHYKTDDKL